MSEAFAFDVFISYSAKDKVVVRALANRLREDNLRVWFDEWELKPGDSIPSRIEQGLEQSRALILCMSANAFASDWVQLESGTFRFRDPANRERRFIPLRLDDHPIMGSLAQFLCVDWLTPNRGREYSKLLEACRPRDASARGVDVATEQDPGRYVDLPISGGVRKYAFSRDGKRVLASCRDGSIQLWDFDGELLLRKFVGHEAEIWGVAWTPDERAFLSAGQDKTVRMWNPDNSNATRVLKGQGGPIAGVTVSLDGRYAVSYGWPWAGDAVRVWDLRDGKAFRGVKAEQGTAYCAAFSSDSRRILVGFSTGKLRLMDLRSTKWTQVMEGHTDEVSCLVWHSEMAVAVSGSKDGTLRVWDTNSGNCQRVLEGHLGGIRSLALHPDGRTVVSGSEDRTMRLWNLDSGRNTGIRQNLTGIVQTVHWKVEENRVLAGDNSGRISEWDLSEYFLSLQASGTMPQSGSHEAKQIQYSNAKVLLVGESGAGKTGLSKRLAVGKWKPSDSTVGAWATQWKLPVQSGSNVEREIWLWDFGGQADQRLIHQLYMDETATAVFVFDGQKEDLFETLSQWDHDLSRAARKGFGKILVAGRVDAGGLRFSRHEIERFAADRKFLKFFETSAKTNQGCNELKAAILASINWDALPCRTTAALFKRLKEEVIRLKDEGRVLIRFNELRDALQLRLSHEFKGFSDEELHAVLKLLAGPGMVWELTFGSWVLLQPERINAYAQAVIQTLQADEHQRGCVMEDHVLNGALVYSSSMERLAKDEERFVLLAMHQTLLEQSLCLRQPTSRGNLLVFPSFYRRERPEIVRYPAVLVNYKFLGFLDEVYATLVVRLHHVEAFQQDQLWRYAADFKTNSGKTLGIKLTRQGPGEGELEVYFDPAIATEEKIIFSKYIHEHLLQHARDVQRLRHYVCQSCGTAVGNREVAMNRLNDWLQRRPSGLQGEGHSSFHKEKERPPSIICVNCEKRVALWDDVEQFFASPDIQRRVSDMQHESAIVLDNESKERALVGEVISTVALAGQISREFNVSDHGIDMEVEFKDDANEATGAKVYLQLKSGDSYLREKKGTGEEIFTIRDERHARYWSAQAFPVFLVIRNSEGEVRWMEIREVLRQGPSVKQIAFKGERFDVMGVRRWREVILADHSV